LKGKVFAIGTKTYAIDGVATDFVITVHLHSILSYAFCCTSGTKMVRYWRSFRNVAAA